MSNKTYRLLKDLPTIKAGAIYQEKQTPAGYHILEVLSPKGIFHSVQIDQVNDFDEWFEEIEVFEIPDGFSNCSK